MKKFIENKEFLFKNLKRMGFFLGLFGLFLVIFFITFRFISPLNKTTKNFFKYIPFPIATIDNKKFITTKELLSNQEALKNFYSSQNFSDLGLRVDFTTEDGEKRLKIKEREIFNKLIEDKLIREISEEIGINVSKKEASQELTNKSKETGNIENLALKLKKTYGWSLFDFRDKIIIPRLYLKKLMKYHKENIANKESENQKINKALNELKNGINFEEVAIKYSEGETSKNGGRIGWFKKSYLVEEIAEKAYSMEPGNFSEIIKTSLGSHIIYLEEVRETENEEKEVKLKQIYTKEGSFFHWIQNQKSTHSVKIYVPDYKWNKEMKRLEFSNPSFEKEETLLRDKSTGDPIFY